MAPQELWHWVHSCYGDELGLTSSDDDYVPPPNVVEGKDPLGKDLSMNSKVCMHSFCSMNLITSYLIDITLVTMNLLSINLLNVNLITIYLINSNLIIMNLLADIAVYYSVILARKLDTF